MDLRYRFTLTVKDASPPLSMVISEPEGWKQIKMTLDRDKDFMSLIELFEVPLIFYGSNGTYDAGRDFIEEAILAYGLDVQIEFLSEISETEGILWEDLFVGLLDIQSKKKVDSRKTQFVILRNDFWSKFKNRYDTSVDLKSNVTLDGLPVYPTRSINLNLTSQSIRQYYSAHLKHNSLFTDAGGSDKYGIIEFDVIDISEIEETYNYSLGETGSLPFEKFYLKYDSTGFTVDCKITLGDYLFSTLTGNDNKFGSTIGKIHVYLQVNGNSPIEFDADDITIPEQTITLNDGTDVLIEESILTEYTINTTLPLKKNDAVRIYTFQDGGDATGFAAHIFGINGDGQQTSAINPQNLFDPSNAAGVFQGFYSPSLGVFPSPAGANAFWVISQDGEIQGVPVFKNWVIRAIISSPGQTVANWYINQYNVTENLYALGESYLNVTNDTSLPETNNEGFLLHDVAHGILERTTNEKPFYSEFLGSSQTIERQYLNDGCGWNYSLIRGLQIRQYTLSEKPFSISFKQWWEGANPILNLGLTYDTIAGDEVIRVEDKAYFFDPNPILTFDFVNNIEESFDKDYIFKKVKIGYQKWQSEDISGIDDPQTNREYATLLKTVGTEFSKQSDFIAASYAIETTRRTTKEKSADYKFDNDTFIISINPIANSPFDPATYEPELDENFDSLSNLLNPETRYNIRLSAARNLLRWSNIIFGCLQDYLSSFLTFTKGDGNYDMTSEMAVESPDCGDGFNANSLSEKQDIPVTDNYLFKPILKEFKYPLSYSDYKLIRDNRTRAIAISETDEDHTICFIKRLDYDINKSLGTFITWVR